MTIEWLETSLSSIDDIEDEAQDATENAPDDRSEMAFAQIKILCQIGRELASIRDACRAIADSTAR